MSIALQSLYWLAGLVVLAEALNKLERCAPFARGLSLHERLVDGLKAMAWSLLAIGSAGIVFDPLLQQIGADLPGPMREGRDAALAVGFSVLIVRTRVKEG